MATYRFYLGEDDEWFNSVSYAPTGMGEWDAKIGVVDCSEPDALFNLVVTSGENPGVEAPYMAQAYNVPIGHYVKFDIPTYFDMTIISVSVSSATDDDLHGTLEILL